MHNWNCSRSINFKLRKQIPDANSSLWASGISTSNREPILNTTAGTAGQTTVLAKLVARQSSTVLNAVLKYQQLPRHISDSCKIVILPEMVHYFLYIFCRISRDDERNLNSLKLLTNFRLVFVFQATTFTFLIWDAVVISPQTAICGSKGRHLSAYFDCIFSLGWHCFKCWKEVFIWIKLS